MAFYRDCLGFMLVKRPETFNETFEGAWLWGYGMGLHLIKGQPVPRSKHIDPKSDHLSFQADSLEEVEVQLRALGIPFVRQVVVEDGIEMSQLFFHDCDNNMIEVCNCDCLPVIPLELGCPQACTLGHACASKTCGQHQPSCRSHADEDEEMSSDGSRDSLDSSRSEHHHHNPDQFHTALALLPANR